MLKVISVDAVRINLPIDPTHYPKLLRHFWALVKKSHAKFGEKKNTGDGVWGHWCELNTGGSPLYVGIKGFMGVRFIEYGFKGIPNFLASSSATETFENFSFGHALAKGKVKNFELAVDCAGKHTCDVISHLKGAKSSKMFTNPAGDGTTQYSGSSRSALQLSVYDKAVEMAAKKFTPYAEKILRIELRFRNRDIPLGALLQQAQDENPFHRVRITDKGIAISAFPDDMSWKLFIHNCEFKGAACALQTCGPSKKTYLSRLKQLSGGNLAPQLNMFTKNIESLSNVCSLADAMCG